MIDLIKKVIHDCLTEDNGTSYCWAKIASTFALFNYVITAMWTMYHAVDSTLIGLFQAFGTNLAVVLGGCGAVIAAKQATQKPDQNPR